MPYYKLVASGRPDVVVDEVIISRSESGEVEKSVSTTGAVELSGDELSSARGAAKLLGYTVVETEAPDEKSETGQQVGDDVVGMSPVIEQSDPEVGPTVDQQEQQKIVEEAESPGPAVGGAGGVSGSAPAGDGGAVTGESAPTGTPAPAPSNTPIF